ncbi:hypothetical protein NKJ84_00270 [Mesorhizobium sp. M0048]|uniref:hypothetical protein n=1 Tax=Mesorhizobium sp. M0048 TaxID=2956860 RepID=UPI00333B3E99
MKKQQRRTGAADPCENGRIVQSQAGGSETCKHRQPPRAPLDKLSKGANGRLRRTPAAMAWVQAGQLLESKPDPHAPAEAPPAPIAISPVNATDPSPSTPAAPTRPVPPAMIDWLHLGLSFVVVEGFDIRRLEFIENAASGSWNAGHCVDWPNCACKGRGPGNAKHSCQK